MGDDDKTGDSPLLGTGCHRSGRELPRRWSLPSRRARQPPRISHRIDFWPVLRPWIDVHRLKITNTEYGESQQALLEPMVVGLQSGSPPIFTLLYDENVPQSIKFLRK